MVSSSIFQKFSGEGLTEPPPQTPPPFFLGLRPRFGLRPQFSGASRLRIGLRPRFSGASRPRFGLRPQLSVENLVWPPQNKFLDPPLPSTHGLTSKSVGGVGEWPSLSIMVPPFKLAQLIEKLTRNPGRNLTRFPLDQNVLGDSLVDP